MPSATLPADVSKLRERLQQDQAPSAKSRTDYFDLAALRGQIGARPYSSRRVSINQCYEMRTDSVIQFALLVGMATVLAASWHIECRNARKAAFIDNALKQIYGRLILQFYGAVEFGFQGMAKEFIRSNPTWEYLQKDETGEWAAHQVWDRGDVLALLWDAFVPLRPEVVEPMYDDGNGSFKGIKLNNAMGGFQIQGLSPILNPQDNTPTKDSMIDLEHCSPPDEPVLTVNRGYVPIGDLTSDDRLVCWDKKQKRINRVKGYSFQTAVRPYSGDLLTVSAGTSQTRVTPSHKLTVRWTPEAEEKRAVYLMRKGDWWRIGTAQIVMRKAGPRSSGISHRVHAENADAAWILGVFDTKNEALYHERLWSHQYGVPDMVFQDVQRGRSIACLDTGQLEDIWGQIDSRSGAQRILSDFNLDERLPFYPPESNNRARTARGPRGWTCAAANLVPGMMEVPVDEGSLPFAADWEVLDVKREHYEGDVVSLEVPPHHHYVSGNGVIVQNSLWVTNERDRHFGSPWGYPRLGYAYKYWWAYEMTLGILNRSTERKGDPTIVVSYPIGTSDIDGEKRDNQDIAFEIAEMARSGSILVLPSEVWGDDDKGTGAAKWKIDYLKAEENFDGLRQTLSYLDTMRFRSMMTSELAVAEGSGGTSSRNVAATTGERTAEVQFGLQLEFDDIINRYLIPQLSDANFWEPEIRNEPARKVTKTFGQGQIEFFKTITESFANSNADKLPIDWTEMFSILGAPVLDAQSVADARNQLAAQTQQRTPAPQEATPGGNAGVTDTGFYYDARDMISLAEDEAFLASLPSSTHYQDRTVIAHTRLIRKIWFDLLTDQYEDFAKHLESDTSTALSFAEGDPKNESAIRKRVEKMVGGWRYASKTYQQVVKRTAAALSTVFARAGALELKRSNINLDGWDPSEKELATWVNNNAASRVKKIDQTTRKNLNTFLVDQVKKDKTPKEIAAGLREHFAQFPGWRADLIAREEVARFYNAATLFAAKSSKRQVQALDARLGPTDHECEERNGNIYGVDAAWKEEEKEHVRGTLAWRIVASKAELSVERVSPEEMGDWAARIDREKNAIVLRNDLDLETEGRYLVQAVDWFENVPSDA